MNHQSRNLHTIRRNYPLVLLSCLVLGLTGCNWIELVSVSSTGNQSDESSGFASISANGRYVAFASTASNLVANDTLFASDVFVRDTLNDTTTRISVDNAGNEAYGNSYSPSVSGDGRYVSFHSNASNLVDGDTNNNAWDVFVRDLNTGVLSRISVSSAGMEGNGSSTFSSISGDGRYIAFVSTATNLVAGGTTFNRSNIYVHDRNTGTTTLVSVDNAGNEGNGGAAGSSVPAISSDGRYVAFASTSSNLVAGGTTVDRKHIFVHDRNTATTSLVSLDSAGNEGNDGLGYAGQSNNPSISSDGRYIAFDSTSSNLVVGDTNNTGDIFVRDTLNGTTTRASVDSAGNQAIGNGSTDPTVSNDGRYIAFYSFSSGLVAGDTNGVADIFVHDRNTGATKRVSLDEAGVEANGASDRPSISGDGHYVAFSSYADNLVEGDLNVRGIKDIIIRAVPEVTVTSVIPNKLTIGTTVAVTVSGSNFLPGSTPQVNGASLTNIVIVNENTITANITVQANSLAGARDVSVSLPGTGPGASAGSVGTCTNCVTFKVPSGCG